jgi:hypothetical protein
MILNEKSRDAQESVTALILLTGSLKNLQIVRL